MSAIQLGKIASSVDVKIWKIYNMGFTVDKVKYIGR